MKRQVEWEEIWQGQMRWSSAVVDRWAPWLALGAAVAIVVVGAL